MTNETIELIKKLQIQILNLSEKLEEAKEGLEKIELAITEEIINDSTLTNENKRKIALKNKLNVDNGFLTLKRAIAEGEHDKAMLQIELEKEKNTFKLLLAEKMEKGIRYDI